MAFLENKVAVVTRIRAKRGMREWLEKELIKMMSPLRSKEGCINYSIHRHSTDMDLLMTYEVWESMKEMVDDKEPSHITHFTRTHGKEIEGMPETTVWDLVV
ncbi:MAG: antibiotic biosynthesis monooxygenase [Candidatus Omnitrophica bacterium]|nr:antibiotic biosynthesis monooxygenase [Candidatus Omnitrophota bacterium]MDD5487860.1 antibiotic biosynthesis monooxygenase [Candidatus Omnitrophota bacterium]